MRLRLLYCISETTQIKGQWFVRLAGYDLLVHDKPNCWLPSTDFRLVSGSSLSDHSPR